MGVRRGVAARRRRTIIALIRSLIVLNGLPEMCVREDTDAEDACLLGRLAAGDHDALAPLYHRHGATLLSYLRRFFDQPEVAEEVLQDAFVSAWRGAAGFAHRSTVRAWLLGIARRQALNRLRRDRALPPSMEFADEQLTAGETNSITADDPAMLAQARCDREEVAAALHALRPLDREVLGLLLVDELSYAEMAAVLAVPIGTVRSRVSNARHRLAERLRAIRSEPDG
jgi:RNA polymerase sigma-70 factor (ECF subfamily)